MVIEKGDIEQRRDSLGYILKKFLFKGVGEVFIDMILIIYFVQ